MSFLKQFVIPFKGLLDGHHEYEFHLDAQFFKEFEASPIHESDLTANVRLNKHLDLMTVQLKLEGWVRETCDRCLADINLPLTRTYDLVFKREEGESEDPDLILLSPDAHEFSLAGILYEYACLSVPLSKIYNCAKSVPKPCNEDVLKHISTEIDINDSNPIWDVLKNIKNN